MGIIRPDDDVPSHKNSGYDNITEDQEYNKQWIKTRNYNKRT